MSNTSTMLDYARIGAAARLAEIAIEVAALQDAFPELEGPAQERHGGRPKAQAAASDPQPEVQAQEPVAVKRKRRKMSAAARQAISDAQKKRWAAQKAKAA